MAESDEAKNFMANTRLSYTRKGTAMLNSKLWKLELTRNNVEASYQAATMVTGIMTVSILALSCWFGAINTPFFIVFSGVGMLLSLVGYEYTKRSERITIKWAKFSIIYPFVMGVALCGVFAFEINQQFQASVKEAQRLRQESDKINASMEKDYERLNGSRY